MAFSMEAFRKQLRTERKARVGGRDKLAELAGVNRSTVQNAEVGPDIPGIDTVARLVENMPGLTLPDFFAHLNDPTGERTPVTDQPVSPSLAGTTAHDSAVSETSPLVAAINLSLVLTTLTTTIDNAANRVVASLKSFTGARRPSARSRPRRRDGRAKAS